MDSEEIHMEYLNILEDQITEKEEEDVKVEDNKVDKWEDIMDLVELVIDDCFLE